MSIIIAKQENRITECEQHIIYNTEKFYCIKLSFRSLLRPWGAFVSFCSLPPQKALLP